MTRPDSLRLRTNLLLTSLATSHITITHKMRQTKQIFISHLLYLISRIVKAQFKYFGETAVICKRWKKLIQHEFQHFNNCSRHFLLTFAVIHHLTNYMRINYANTKSNQEKMF